MTVTGGKWTTYRAMAEDVLDHCFKAGLLAPRNEMVTDHLKLVGAQDSTQPELASPRAFIYMEAKRLS